MLLQAAGHGEVFIMTAGEIALKARLYLKDMQMSSVSEWELLQGINDAIRLFAEEFSRVNDPNGVFSKKAEIATGITDNALLPAGYIKPIKAYALDGRELLRVFREDPMEGEYSVSALNILSGETSVILCYYGYPQWVENYSSVIELPASMTIPVAKVTAICVSGLDSAAVQLARYFTGQTLTADSQSGNTTSTGNDTGQKS